MLSCALLGFISCSATWNSDDGQRKFDGTFFEVISGADKANVASMQGTFHESFHQCGMDESCKFVLKNIKISEFHRIFDESDLPKDRKNFIIWQKVAKKQIKGKTL